MTGALGSVIELTDGSGAIATEYRYEPFGTMSMTGAPTGNPFAFTGREEDGTGLKYYRARYYHPGLQRFISEDPIGLAAGDVNFYVYVANNPINFVDALGLDKGKNCQSVPSAPPAVNLDANIRLAGHLAAAPVDPLLGYGEWLGRVWPGGKWDYKEQGKTREQKIEYEKFGNFNYGATGAAIGIPDRVLLIAAGTVQYTRSFFGHPYRPSFGRPWSGSPYGDDPGDQVLIQSGIDYYRSGCAK